MNNFNKYALSAAFPFLFVASVSAQVLSSDEQNSCESILCLSSSNGAQDPACEMPYFNFFSIIEYDDGEIDVSATQEARKEYLDECPNHTLSDSELELMASLSEEQVGLKEPSEAPSSSEEEVPPSSVGVLPEPVIPDDGNVFVDDGSYGRCYQIANTANRTTSTDGFVWKPVSEGDGNLVVLFPSYSMSVGASIYAGGEVISGSFSGRTNGDRPTVRFSLPGAGYSNGLTVCDGDTG